MKESDFTDLINRYEQGRCTPEEKKQVEQWLNSGINEVKPFHNEEQREKIKMALRNAVFEGAGLSAKRSSFWPAVYKIAASVLLIAAIGYGSFKYYKSEETGQYAAIEIHSGSSVRKVMLTDGSIIWLKENSTLNYPQVFTGSERSVTLHGEALFEVAKDPAHPFVISCGELTTRVLGTSFSIKTSANNIEVLVLTGKVSLTSRKTNQNLVVVPNEKALFTIANNQLVKVPVTRDAQAEATVNTEYAMNFKATRMDEIIRRMEGKFDVKISVGNRKLNQCTITADFTDQSLEQTLNTIAEILDLNYEIKGNTVMLNGAGCD